MSVESILAVSHTGSLNTNNIIRETCMTQDGERMDIFKHQNAIIKENLY